MLTNLAIVVVIVWFTCKQAKISKEQKEITGKLSTITELQKEITQEIDMYRIDLDLWKTNIVIKLDDIAAHQNEHHNEIVKEEQEIGRLLISINRQHRDIAKELNNIAREINHLFNVL